MIGALVMDLVRRAVVTLVTESTRLRTVQAQYASDDVRDAEHFEPYGFTSRAAPGAEAIGLSVGGEHTVVICVADRRYRLTSLAEGEVALYDAEGSSVTLKADGKIVIDAAATIELGAGATEALVRGTSFRALYNAHTHSNPEGGTTGAPVVPMGTDLLSTVGKVL